MGWLWLFLLLAATAGGLWVAGKLRGAALQVTLAALMLGAAGYALQGEPDLPGAPREGGLSRPALPLTEARQAMLGHFTAGERYLLIADSYARRGNTTEELGAIRAGLKAYPDNLALKIGLANALVDHAQMITPPAELAYERARQAAPRHPAPLFFEGLARARSGDLERSLELFRAALALTPEGTSYRPMIEQAVAMVGNSLAEQQARSRQPDGQGAPPAPQRSPQP
ncbi:tetratricopeptide repeat protein [Sphingomonas sp. LHG3443-2]|uniref:tetratricopeptide repeat protein n=1 Tax=Sphingomonas sp. LHG3443-2 TaxID=2804639 RepID=UPI003CF08C2A